LKKHQLEVSFNAPEKAGTKICFNVYPGGDLCYKIHSNLKHKYADTILKSEIDALLKEEDSEMKVESFEFGYVEIKLKMNGDSS
jgi:hypothetical protein